MKNKSKQKMSFEHKLIVKAHNESKTGLKLIKKGGNYSDTPLFKTTIQAELF